MGIAGSALPTLGNNRLELVIRIRKLTETQYSSNDATADGTQLFNYNGNTEPGLAKLERSRFSPRHWLTDDAGTDHEIDLYLSSARKWRRANDGETPRNIIAMQGMRVRDPLLDDILYPHNELIDWVDIEMDVPEGYPPLPPLENRGDDEVEITSWQRRPRKPEAMNSDSSSYDPPFNPEYDPMAGGWRYYPTCYGKQRLITLDSARRGL